MINEISSILHAKESPSKDETLPKYIDLPTPYLPGRFVAPTGVQRYIRADLVAGDANEPLASGQYRWIKQGSDDEWEPAFVSAFGPCDDPDFEFTIIGEDDSISVEREDVAKIGPVIRPPSE